MYVTVFCTLGRPLTSRLIPAFARFSKPQARDARVHTRQASVRQLLLSSCGRAGGGEGFFVWVVGVCTWGGATAS